MTTQRASTDPTRKTALVAGILYLVTYAASIPAALLLSTTLADPSYILGAGADGQIRLAALFDIVNGLTAFGTAVALFSVVKRQHEGLAISFVVSRLFEAAILFIGVVSVVSIANLRDTAATAADPAALAGAGVALVTQYKVAFVLGTAIPALNAFLLGSLLLQGRLVPRAIPALGLIGAVTFGIWNIGYVLGVTEPGTPWHGISVAPIFFWELFVGAWMTFKGFNRTAPIVMAAMATQSTPAERTATSVRTDADATATAGAA